MKIIRSTQNTHMLLNPSNYRSCDSNVTARGSDVLCRRGKWPNGKVLLVEGREEPAEGLGSVVSPIQLVLAFEPLPLIKGTCGWLK